MPPPRTCGWRLGEIWLDASVHRSGGESQGAEAARSNRAGRMAQPCGFLEARNARKVRHPYLVLCLRANQRGR